MVDIFKIWTGRRPVLLLSPKGPTSPPCRITVINNIYIVVYIYKSLTGQIRRLTPYPIPGTVLEIKNLCFLSKINTDSYCLIPLRKEFNSVARGHWNCCCVRVTAIGAVINSVTHGNPVNYLYIVYFDCMIVLIVLIALL